jgi:glycerol-3-phosphate acyltransferase PlsY
MMRRPLPPLVFGVVVLPLLTVLVVVVFLTFENAPVAAQYASVLALSYLLGSIPWGYLLLVLRRGVDIREYGSGRTGMTNVLRTGGGKLAIVVLALDLGKGILAVLMARVVIGPNAPEVAAGLFVLVGHNWPVFLQFRGGRGILTGLGGLSIMAPIPAALAAIAFVFATLFSRYVSLGSLTGVVIAFISVLAMALAGVYSSTYTLYAFLGGAIIIWQHRDNIQRIRQGNERRLGQPADKII